MNNRSCIVGIDPGSAYLGLSTIYFDSLTKQIVNIKAKTLYGAMYPQDKIINEIYGSTQSMIMGHRKALLEHFCTVNPIAVFSESPFYNSRMPAAYGSLVKTMEYIKLACIEYDSQMFFKVIDPPTAKKAVGAPGNSRDKEDVLKALAKCDFYDKIEFEEITEHAVDSIAVGIWGYKDYIV